jgi:hypothetical protein
MTKAWVFCARAFSFIRRKTSQVHPAAVAAMDAAKTPEFVSSAVKPVAGSTVAVTPWARYQASDFLSKALNSTSYERDGASKAGSGRTDALKDRL